MNLRIVTLVAAGLFAGSAVAQETAPAPDLGAPTTVIPEVISPDPIAPGIDAPDLPEPPTPGADEPASPQGEAPQLEAPELEESTDEEGAAEAVEETNRGPEAPPAEAMLAEEDLQAFIRGHTYQGVDPTTDEVVATVSYGLDGSSMLTLPDGREESGTYRFEGNTYCTRYEAFRDGGENCFTLEPLGDGRAQAWYTDGRRALILTPAT